MTDDLRAAAIRDRVFGGNALDWTMRAIVKTADANDPLRLALQDEAVIRRLANVKTPGGVQRVLESLQ